MSIMTKADRTVRVTALVGLLSLAVAACSSATSPASAGGSPGNGGTLYAATNGSGPWSPVFNPFSPSYNYAFGFGAVYEPLFMVDPKTQSLTPWLATGYSWGDGGDVLNLTVRKGVKWSNGKPFTASDVAFTFQLENKIAAESGGATQLTSATASGNSVVLRYSSPQYVNFDTIALNTPIVPPFTFAGVSDPLKFEDSHPIGTGPFTLASETPQYITYKRNPGYWQKGKPAISEVVDVSADSNSTMEALLIAHRISYSGVFTSDIFKTFVNRDPAANKVYTPPNGTVSLALNQSDPAFRSLALRQAISDALNRTALDNIGESGAEPPASQSGLSGSATAPYVDSRYSQPVVQDVTKASSVLAAAGYKLTGGKLYAPGSTSPLSFSLMFPSSYSDWMTDCSLIEGDLGKIGIGVSCDGVSYQTWSADEGTSQFQATFFVAQGPTAYDEYNTIFAVPSGGLPAAGQPNGGANIERYVSPAAESALSTLRVTNPSDVSAVKAQTNILQAIMARGLPVIPLFQSTDHEDFVNGPLYGWPSGSDPYMCTYCNAYQEQILLAVHK